ncbi:TetR/AcrR family transcriptional regulator [Actinomadura kijaniata]|uniref:AcrR family transcriptional regulator n=1 Tax=Actinomadura namibiensis TaxID=182080 RepID=A0A7W3LXZ6_ACTNM|nr:TetR/AcrR family transcriptional regulator [Actinomadura namibiensis]MBA8956378.1 AcrR family transcriptional regulator [Actinomadura namibiensis]
MVEEEVEEAPAIGRRERNKQRVRERIYASAISLFAEEGYDQATVDAIADRADVARGTFFNYFQHKEDIINAWEERRGAKLRTRLEESLSSKEMSAALLMRMCLSILAELNEEERDVAPALVTAWVKTGKPILAEPHIAAIFTELVERGQRRGEIRADVEAERVGNLLRDAYLGILFRWSRVGPSGMDIDQELQYVLKICLRGILA